MSDPAVTLPAASESVSLLEPDAVLAAVCDPVRHALLCALVDGRPQSVNNLAEAKLNRPADGISKHLRVLRDARLIRVVTPPGCDGRKQHHELPGLFRSRDCAGKTLLDFGAVLVRVE